MTSHRTSGINNSTSKHIYGFAKSGRFGGLKSYNSVSCYDHKSQFNSNELKPAAGFMCASKRFGNNGVGKSDIRNWAPHGDNYYGVNFAGQMGKTMSHQINDHKNRTQSYSFGVSRGSMKKLHVDKIQKNVDGYVNVPGSGSYAHKDGFGGSSHNETTCFSMRKKLYHDELALNKSKKLPGPGFYQHPDQLGATIHNSTVKSSNKLTISKANDRFKRGSFDIPGANHYNPSDELNNNFNSQRKFAGQTRIGRETTSFMDTEWMIKDKAHGPGPGHYARFSDFKGLEDVKHVAQGVPTAVRK